MQEEEDMEEENRRSHSTLVKETTHGVLLVELSGSVLVVGVEEHL